MRPDELDLIIKTHPDYDATIRDKALAQSKVTANRFSARHNNGGNIVFADGHVELVDNYKINTGTGLIKKNYYNVLNLVVWNPTPLGN